MADSIDRWDPRAPYGVVWSGGEELPLTVVGDDGRFGVYALVHIGQPEYVLDCLARFFPKHAGHLLALPHDRYPDGVPVYFGKGLRTRRDQHFKRTDYGHRLTRYIRKYKAEIEPRWIMEPTATEAEAFKREGELTNEWGLLDRGGTLLNYRDGGRDGAAFGPEMRAKHKVVMKEVMSQPEVRAKHKAVLNRPEHLARLRMQAKVHGPKNAADPVWREKTTAANRKMAADPAFQKKHAAALRKLATDPVWQEKNAAGARKRSADPAWLAKNRERATTPEGLEQRRRAGIKSGEASKARAAARRAAKAAGNKP
jgi:hypothetical protein